MVVGEDKTKVLNIVKPNIAHFRELYGSILQENPQVVYKSQQGRLEVNCMWKIACIVSKTRAICRKKVRGRTAWCENIYSSKSKYCM